MNRFHHYLFCFYLLHCSVYWYGVNCKEQFPSTTTQVSVQGKEQKSQLSTKQSDQGGDPFMMLSDQSQHQQTVTQKSTNQEGRSLLKSEPEQNGAQPHTGLLSRPPSEYIMTKPGEFTMISNKEIAPGHVTMIGFTTPIVKVGAPIPLEEFYNQHPGALPSRLAENPKYSKLIQAKPSQFTPVQSQQPSQHYKPILKPSTLADSRKELTIPSASSIDITERLQKYQAMKFPQNSALYSDAMRPNRYQMEPEQEQRFSAPLEKPRPFVVYKPSYLNKYQQLQLQQLQQQYHQNGGISQYIPTKALPLPEVNDNEPTSLHGRVSVMTGSPKMTPYDDIVSRHAPLPFSDSKQIPLSPLSLLSQSGQSQLQSFYGSQYKPNYGQPNEYDPMRSLRLLQGPSSQSVQEESSSKQVDPKTELQNQINFVLTNTPNLSQDSRHKHREAIIKAVQASFDEVDSRYVPPPSGHHQSSEIQRPRPVSVGSLYSGQSRPETSAKMIMSGSPNPFSVMPAYDSFRQSAGLQQQIAPLLPPVTPLSPSYKPNMQKQIQQYLREQIENESKNGAHISQLINGIRRPLPNKYEDNLFDRDERMGRMQMNPAFLLSSQPEAASTASASKSKPVSTESNVSSQYPKYALAAYGSQNPRNELTSSSQVDSAQSSRGYSEWWKERAVQEPLNPNNFIYRV